MMGKDFLKIVTSTVDPQLGQLGMVTDAKWADIKGDRYENIVVVGECMGIKIFIMKMGN